MRRDRARSAKNDERLSNPRHRRHIRFAFWPPLGVGLLLLACSPAASKKPAESGKNAAPAGAASPGDAKNGSPLDAAFLALRRSDYKAAEALFQQNSAAEPQLSRRGLAELELKRGQIERALELTRASDAAEARAFGVVRAHALRRWGRLDEALEALGPALPALEALVLRGEILRELGRRDESVVAFEQAAQEAGQAATTHATPDRAPKPHPVDPRPPSPAEIAYFEGLAAFFLRDPAAANEAWERAEEASGSEPDPRLLVRRAQLYAERHDGPEALGALEDALELAPKDPDVLVALGELKLHELFDFVGALGLAEQALEVDPKHPGALALLAGVALRDLDFAAADQKTELGFSQNPRDLRLLSLRAARHFLAEEPELFEATLQKVEQFSPGYAQVFTDVAELGDFEHRFLEVSELLRRGVQKDREDGHLRAELGLNLSRTGSEATGLLELRRAFELDPYNRRVFNSLELYEKVIPADYDEFDAGHFRFRFPKAERALLERYVPAWVEKAYETYQKAYGYQPPGRITVELYQDRQDFAVRTSGLPEIGLEGVCFGRKIASVSPAAGAANLGMTLWHEMAHVFHLGLSKNRVPRWLTEGLAEWETDHLDRGWVRMMDRELYQAERAGRIPKLETMNRAFTRADSLAEVGLAYAAAGQLATFLQAEDRPRTVHMLGELGKKRPLLEVLHQSLGPDLSGVDARFTAWLRARLRRFDGQFLGPIARTPQRSAAPVRCSPELRAVTLDQVLELLAQADPDCTAVAETSLEALFLGHPEPESGLLLARLLEARDEPERAVEVLELAAQVGPDGVSLELAKARLARNQKRLDQVRIALQRALQLDPHAVEAWAWLAQTENQEGRAEAELDALGHLMALGENNPVAHERYLTLLLRFPKKAPLVQAAQNALWVGLGRASTHRLAALVYRAAGRAKEARFEEETARTLESEVD
jgi:cellulose synthase operon protein C